MLTIKSGASESSGDIDAYIDGTLLTQKSASNQTLNTTNTDMIIGWAGQTVIERLDGKIAEILIYSSELSAADQDSLENYLENKYALAGHTITIDTGTKYTGTASAKVVSPATDTVELTQDINTTDADFYSLVAYAYTDGSAVSSADAQLYYNGAAISTTYTSVGSGWYKLSGTLTGANEIRDYGIQIKTSKTVYLDDFSLTKYASTGTLTSNTFNAEFPADWGILTYNSSGSGTVTVKIRSDSSSDMSGATAWASCSGISSGSDITANSCVSDSTQYLQYQITLEPSEANTPTFQDISIGFTASDVTVPPTNASSVSITNVSEGVWTNTEPTIIWTAGADNVGGVGLLGYCIALDEAVIGSSDSVDPSTSSDKLNGLDDGVSQEYCNYIVEGTSLNLSSVTGLTLTSNKQYYFSIKAVDLAGNVWTGDSSEFQDLASFKYDGTSPENPTGLSAPQTYKSTINSFTIYWPTSGDNMASDSASGIKGYQYKVSSGGTWYGDSHTGNQDCNDLITSGSYSLDDTYDSLTEGENTFFFRTYDNSCNISETNLSAILKYSGNAPTEPQSLEVTPSTNATNSFAFSWQAPETYTGQNSSISYCYTVNTVPSFINCTWTSNTSLSADAYATQPSTNTFYIVAKDEAANINYDAYSSVEFTANTSAPGISQNVDIADISVKATSSWKLAVSWEEPASIGTGIANYKIYHSTDGSNYTLKSTSTGISYFDTSLTQTTHYYKIKACDSANNCGADSSYVNRFTFRKNKGDRSYESHGYEVKRSK